MKPSRDPRMMDSVCGSSTARLFQPRLSRTMARLPPSMNRAVSPDKIAITTSFKALSNCTSVTDRTSCSIIVVSRSASGVSASSKRRISGFST
nr:hypothetical protein [Paenibacillus glycinis]